MHTCPTWLIRGFPISLVQSLVEEGTHFSIILLPLIQKVAYGHLALYALVLHIQKRHRCPTVQRLNVAVLGILLL